MKEEEQPEPNHAPPESGAPSVPAHKSFLVASGSFVGTVYQSVTRILAAFGAVQFVTTVTNFEWQGFLAKPFNVWSSFVRVPTQTLFAYLGIDVSPTVQDYVAVGVITLISAVSVELKPVSLIWLRFCRFAFWDISSRGPTMLRLLPMLLSAPITIPSYLFMIAFTAVTIPPQAGAAATSWVLYYGEEINKTLCEVMSNKMLAQISLLKFQVHSFVSHWFLILRVSLTTILSVVWHATLVVSLPLILAGVVVLSWPLYLACMLALLSPLGEWLYFQMVRMFPRFRGQEGRGLARRRIGNVRFVTAMQLFPIALFGIAALLQQLK
jgi:hypothetical protein